jgi:hypothetical protein
MCTPPPPLRTSHQTGQQRGHCAGGAAAGACGWARALSARGRALTPFAPLSRTHFNAHARLFCTPLYAGFAILGQFKGWGRISDRIAVLLPKLQQHHERGLDAKEFAKLMFVTGYVVGQPQPAAGYTRSSFKDIVGIYPQEDLTDLESPFWRQLYGIVAAESKKMYGSGTEGGGAGAGVGR